MTLPEREDARRPHHPIWQRNGRRRERQPPNPAICSANDGGGPSRIPSARCRDDRDKPQGGCPQFRSGYLLATRPRRKSRLGCGAKANAPTGCTADGTVIRAADQQRSCGARRWVVYFSARRRAPVFQEKYRQHESGQQSGASTECRTTDPGEGDGPDDVEDHSGDDLGGCGLVGVPLQLADERARFVAPLARRLRDASQRVVRRLLRLDPCLLEMRHQQHDAIDLALEVGTPLRARRHGRTPVPQHVLEVVAEFVDDRQVMRHSFPRLDQHRSCHFGTHGAAQEHEQDRQDSGTHRGEHGRPRRRQCQRSAAASFRLTCQSTTWKWGSGTSGCAGTT